MTGIDSTPPRTAESRSLFARLGTPHMFNPNLGPADALIAVTVCLARIFGSCLLFAFWGGLCAWAWTAIGSRFWRVAAVGSLALLFPAALATVLLAIGAIQKKIKTRG